jgi:Flp pilus assembly protein TadD
MVVVKSPRTYIVLLVLCVLGLLVYANAIAHPFVHDDIVYIQWNPFIGRWDNILDVFLHPQLPFGHVQTPYYRPVLEIFYRLEFLLFGMNAWGFHLVNILIHIVNAWLIYLCARRLRWAHAWAFFIAIIFLVHPIQTEAVACVSGISNLAVVMFMLLALLSHMRGRAAGKVVVWGALGFCLLAFFTKEQALVFAAIILLYEILYRRESMVVKARVILPFVVMTGCFWAWRMHLFPGFASEIGGNPHELKLRILAMARVIGMDLGLIFWPVDLHYYRSVNVLAPHGWTWGVLTGLTAMGAWFVGQVPFYVRRGILFGLGLAGVMLLPGLNILPLINEYSWILTAEHFIYFSLCGVMLALAAAGSFLFRKALGLRRQIMLLVGGALIVSLGMVTVYQNRFWRAEVPLFERTLRFEPGLGRVHMLLARAYANEGRLSDAVKEYTAALQIMQNYVKRTPASMAVHALYQQFVKAVYHDRAQVRLIMGDLQGAVLDYRASLKMAFDGKDSLSANNLGLALLQLGDRTGAREAFMLSLRLDDKQLQAMNNLGMMALERRDHRIAKFWFCHVIKISPGYIPALENLKKVR